MAWIYKQTERGQYPIWTVGTDDDDWQTDSDHSNREDAAARCAYLNGAPADYQKLKEQNEKLKEALILMKSHIDFCSEEAWSDSLQSSGDYKAMSEALKSCES